MKYFIAIDSDSNRDLIVAKSKTDARKLYKKGKRRKSIEGRLYNQLEQKIK